MSLSCIIVDDEPLAVKLLENYVSRTSFLTLQGSYTDSVEAIDNIRKNPSDILFLDIQMPDLNGMELAEMIPQQTRIIFTTAFKQYAFDSYGVNALDFLLKPIRYNKFLAAVEKAKQWFELVNSKQQETSQKDDNNSVFIKADGGLRQVLFDDILYVQGMKDYVIFVLKSKEEALREKKNVVVTHMTMTAAEAMLPKDKFMRINRSYVISLKNIRSVDNNNCVYIGDEIIHVTDAYITTFRAYLSSRLG